MTVEVEQKTGGANKFDRIMSLSPERRIIVDNMLIRGDSAAAVVRMIQEEWALYQDVQPGTLERQIQRYSLDKIQIPEAAKQEVLARIAENHPRIAKRLAIAMEEFDVEAAHLRLVQAQEKRVMTWLQSGAANLPSSAVREDIKLLNAMYIALEHHYLETGKIRRASKQISGQVIDETGKLVEFDMELKEQGAVRRAVGLFMEALKGQDYHEVQSGQQPDTESGGDGEESS